MNIHIIQVPLYQGCDVRGVEQAPRTLMKAGLKKLAKECGHKVVDLGEIEVVENQVEDKYKDHPQIKYFQTILDVNQRLSNRVYQSIASGAFPLVLGGDHALGIGSLAGVSGYVPKLAVIWMDAHADLNIGETSPSGNAHGMALASSIGLGNKELKDIFFKEKKVDPHLTYVLGARDLDYGELKIINQYGVHVYGTQQIKKRGSTSVVDEILFQLEKEQVDGIHLSFDIDILDAALVPGTGTPVANGLCLNEVKTLLSRLFSSNKIVSLDFVEYNPRLDNTKQTLHHCLDILKHIFCHLKD